MRIVRLGELCTIEKGTTGINRAIPGKYPLVVTSEERKSHNEYQFDADAVVIPLVSSTGHGHKSLKRIHFQTGKFAVGSILCAVIPKDKTQLSAEYLYRYLDLNREKELVARMKGMANVTLPLKEIEQVEIPLLTIEQQHNFVKSYKTLEIKSSELSSEFAYQLSLVKLLRQSFLREAMQGKLVPQGRNDEPARELLKKIKTEKQQLIKEKKIKKEKELPPIQPEEIPFEIPKGWVWCRLREAVNSIFDGPFGSHLKTSDYTESGVQVVRLENLGEMKFKANKETFVSESKFETITQHTVFPGDVIIGSFLADGVKCIILPELKYRAIAKADCFTIRIGHLNLMNTYLMFLLSSTLMFAELSKLLRGMTRLRINTTQLKNLPIPLPPVEEQNRIVTKLKQLMNYCDELEHSIKQSQTQNEQLLQQVLREALQPKKEYEIGTHISLAAEP
jgi:type I restriction enzyme S subunit